MTARILSIAGSDSGGGAGIQADIKTIEMLGGYAATAITALTAQNTRGVFGVHPVPSDFVRHQIDLVLTDIGADAIKTGMLANAAIIRAVAAAINGHPAPLVLDPVMVAKGGSPLLAADAVAALKSDLIPRAAVLTPNIPEAEALLGRAILGPAEMEAAGRDLLALGCQAVLVKGGHLPISSKDGDRLRDVLVWADGMKSWTGPRIDTPHTHGTGCTMASAIATGLGQGMDLPAAVTRAREYVARAIAAAPGLGQGHGPLGHGWVLEERADFPVS